MKRIILVLLTLVFSLCFYAGCNNNVEGNNPVTGVKDGYIYVLEFGDVSAKFEKGQATLSLNGGSANAYSSGDKITEVGNYCLEWTDGKQSKTISFRVRHKTPDAPVVSGVKDGDVVEYGTVLKPLFDKGSAVLSNGTDETPFTSGSEISKVGVYTLTVNYQEVCTVVKFEIKLPSYAGQITDEFLGGEINSGWSTSDATLSIENDALVINDMADNNGYCIVSRQFTEIDLIKYPYVEIETSNLYNCSLKFRLSASKYPTATDPVIFTKAYSNGKNYIDVKSYVEQNNLDVSCASLYLQVALEGQAYNHGNLRGVLEGFRSVEKLPEKRPAERYVDNTMDSLNSWVADTARMTWFEGDEYAMGVVLNPTAAYGKFTKRVQFNTVDYPYLKIDVASVRQAYKIDAYVYENYVLNDNVIRLLPEQNTVGVTQIDLRDFFGEDECVDIILNFYIVGKNDNGEETYFGLRGIETTDVSIDPSIVDEYKSVSGFTLTDAYNKEDTEFGIENGQFYLTKAAEGHAKLSKLYNFDFETNGNYLAFAFESNSYVPDDGLKVEILSSNWYRIYVDFTKFAHVETVALENGNILYVGYIAIGNAVKTDGSGATVNWANSKLNNIKFTLIIEYGPEKTIYPKELKIVKELPVLKDASIIEEYKSETDFTLTDGYGKSETVFGINSNKEFYLTKATGGQAKLSKRYNFDFASNGNYLVLTFETNDYTPDAGFKVEILDDKAWYRILLDFTKFTYVKETTLENGRTQYECYIEIGMAKYTGSGKEDVNWANTLKNEIIVTILIEFGNEKTIYCNSLKYSKTLPEGADSQPEEPEIPDEPIKNNVLPENYSSLAGFTLNDEKASMKIEEGDFALTKANGGVAALSKYYDFDFATNGNYLVLTFETEGYTPDVGFVFEVLDDVNWYAIKLTYDNFTYVKKTVLDNGRTQYECYIGIGMAKYTGSGKEDVNWTNTKKDGLKVTIYIQYGAEKTVYLKSLNYATELPKEGE